MLRLCKTHLLIGLFCVVVICPPAYPAQRECRKWFQVTLRGLFVASVIAAIPAAYFANRYHRQKRFEAWLSEISPGPYDGYWGGHVRYQDRPSKIAAGTMLVAPEFWVELEESCKTDPDLKALAEKQNIDWERMRKTREKLYKAHFSPYGRYGYGIYYGYGYGKGKNSYVSEEAGKILWEEFEELKKLEPLIEQKIKNKGPHNHYWHGGW